MAEPAKTAKVTTKGTGVKTSGKINSDAEYEGKFPRIKQEPDTPGKIMVTGIPKNDNYSEADLEKEFAPYGRITEVNIIRDRKTNLPRGFAFITFENPKDAEDATKALEGRNLGGDTPIHCEQAVIGLKKSKQLIIEMRGGGRGRGSRGGDRLRGRGIERGGMGRFMERGGRGMRGRPAPNPYNDMGGMQEEEYYEETFDQEPVYDNFPRGGPFMHGAPGRGSLLGREGPPVRGRVGLRGGPISRGVPPGRGRGMTGMEPPSRGGPPRGGPPRRALLPAPAMRGTRGGYGGPVNREEYYEEEDNGYQEEYYETQGNDPYAEEYEEYYAQTDDYYTRERLEPPRGRGGLLKKRPQPVEEYGYDYQTANPRLQAQAQRRNPASGYVEEEYEEPQMAPSQFERPRARVPPGAAPVARIGRGGAAPRGRGGLLGTDPYSAEESAMYESAGPTSGYEVDAYGDHYGRRPGATPAQRSAPPNRMRPTPPAADVYTTERPKPKPQPLMGEMVPQRRPGLAGPARFAENYESSNAAAVQGRDAYSEVRRPPVRRAEPEYRDPYQAAETDAYVSYPPAARGPPEMSRKRAIDSYEEEVPRGPRRDFEEYRSAAAAAPLPPSKRERLDRSAYEAYSSRQEGPYRLI
ncbi:RNA binding motif protein, X-linked-like-1 isoform X1 [Biomphalaria glabrata]|uniref:RNA binding motif protein, X-linked-like-1 isoform X1 n=1 Tax=Biomphalaria glabrata TaxID=6526 RepID=A0A2C9KLE1_BIOGL|nr:RNA binding motif protein, X-linked-like-1 isoform X1 [Biomphalaria glabrata]XP_055869285.1 RNA binding motif protein, X-linked-like-1 isoform X1 [Biomphalaria glabrata]